MFTIQDEYKRIPTTNKGNQNYQEFEQWILKKKSGDLLWFNFFYIHNGTKFEIALRICLKKKKKIEKAIN